MVAKSNVRTDNEDNKFINNSDGDVCVNTCAEITNTASNPVPVEIVEGSIGTLFKLYNEISSVASSSTATVITHTVPAATTLIINRIEVSGENIAEYSVKIEGVTQVKKRSYWGDFDRTFEFKELTVTAGQTIIVEVSNFRPSSSDFNATLLGSI